MSSSLGGQEKQKQSAIVTSSRKLVRTTTALVTTAAGAISSAATRSGNGTVVTQQRHATVTGGNGFPCRAPSLFVLADGGASGGDKNPCGGGGGSTGTSFSGSCAAAPSGNTETAAVPSPSPSLPLLRGPFPCFPLSARSLPRVARLATTPVMASTVTGWRRQQPSWPTHFPLWVCVCVLGGERGWRLLLQLECVARLREDEAAASFGGMGCGG
ncbi:hypothetical protein AAHE18_09G082400 [Arachis hypogaea]|nr:uncharacterized protein DS421_9g265630 [Arachis hypogaea]